MSVQSVCVHAWGVVCGGCVNTGLHVPMEARHQLQISFLPQQHPTCFLKQGLLQEPRAHQVDWAGPWGSGLPIPLVLKLQLPRHTQLLPIVKKESASYIYKTGPILAEASLQTWSQAFSSLPCTISHCPCDFGDIPDPLWAISTVERWRQQCKHHTHKDQSGSAHGAMCICTLLCPVLNSAHWIQAVCEARVVSEPTCFPSRWLKVWGRDVRKDWCAGTLDLKLCIIPVRDMGT